jgi:enamine deaminase RidA (YjgF/YER057c/UK114 family)
MSIVRIDPEQRFASAVVYGGLVFLSGHVAQNADAGVREQTAEILAAIDAHLAEAGTDKSNLLSVQVFMADISHFDEMNAAWDAWVDKANLPTRATVEAKLASHIYKVEIAGIAALP